MYAYLIACLVFGSTLIAFTIWLVYTWRADDEYYEQRAKKKREKKHLKKLRAQEEHEALLSIKASLEELASTRKTSKT